MPEYAFVRSDDDTVSCLLFYRMVEAPPVGSQVTDDQGIEWRRVFTVPNAAITTQIDPYSVSAFSRSLDGKKVTMGDMWDASKEASDKRAAKNGKDPIRETYLTKYSKERKGMEHSVVKKERFEAMQKELGIKLKV